MESIDKSWELKNYLKGKVACLGMFRRRLRYPQFYGNRLEAAAVDSWISSKLDKREPFMVGRWGSVESRLVGEWLWKKKRFSRKTFLEAHQNAGIFPCLPEVLVQVADCLYSSARSLDLVGCWDSPYQPRLISEVYSTALRCDLSSLEPWLLNCESWLSSLASRRVLVVHPFVKTISSQLVSIDKVFGPGLGLPPCDLKLVKPPVTLGLQTDDFSSWLVALEDLRTRVLSIDFDVALIGCGAYGLPLSAAIKAQGRQSIHLGGSLQLLFGIRGRRWEAMPQYAALMNDSWVRPSQDETPLAANKVDGGCYW